MIQLVTLLSILIATPMGVAAAPAARPAAVPTARPSPAPLLTADQLFSRRALRRARLLIQMRMLQLRDERLECIRGALLRELPAMLKSPAPIPSPARAPANVVPLGCGDLLRY